MADKGNSIFGFSPKKCDWKNICKETSKKYLGGKGAALVKMTLDGLPVPPGLTLTTQLCHEYQAAALKGEDDSEAFMIDLIPKVLDRAEEFKEQFGYMPLLSARSGAPVSMPGMMDTILNIGITMDNFDSWADRLGRKAALDSYRRLIQMMASTAFGIDHAEFEKRLTAARKKHGVETDSELSEKALEALIEDFLDVFELMTGQEFPDTISGQLWAAVEAVFKSWDNPRAKHYRKIHGLDDKMGTAVTVQSMVFGNMGPDSGTGVLFTRNPSNGEDLILGEFLPDAQGEDVVAGIRTPLPLYEMEFLDAQSPFNGEGPWTGVLEELVGLCETLEKSYKDMVDIEFTVQQGKLWVLQSRVGKRSAQAAFKIAYDMLQEGMISSDDALGRLTQEQYRVVKRPAVSPEFTTEANYVGLPACPGVVMGKPVFSAKDAVDCKDSCILITHETTPDDIEGMSAAVGVLTQTGGATSHAAVVARAMDKPCVVGCSSLDLTKGWDDVKSVTIDGATGRVWVNVEVPVVDGSTSEAVQMVTKLCLQGQYYPSMPLPDPELDGMAIAACEWWDDEEALDLILSEIEDFEDLANMYVSLDVTPPSHLRRHEDQVLWDVFGKDLTDDMVFLGKIAEQLKARAPKLKGMLLKVPGSLDDWYADGLSVYSRTDAEPAPADYLVFDRLGK